MLDLDGSLGLRRKGLAEAEDAATVRRGLRMEDRDLRLYEAPGSSAEGSTLVGNVTRWSLDDDCIGKRCTGQS